MWDRCQGACYIRNWRPGMVRFFMIRLCNNVFILFDLNFVHTVISCYQNLQYNCYLYLIQQRISSFVLLCWYNTSYCTSNAESNLSNILLYLLLIQHCVTNNMLRIKKYHSAYQSLNRIWGIHWCIWCWYSSVTQKFALW